MDFTWIMIDWSFSKKWTTDLKYISGSKGRIIINYNGTIFWYAIPCKLLFFMEIQWHFPFILLRIF